MAKRRLQDGEDDIETKAPFGQREPADQDVEMGEFEDPWEDEIEGEDEEVIEGDDVEEEDEDEGTSLVYQRLIQRNGGGTKRLRGVSPFKTSRQGSRFDA